MIISTMTAVIVGAAHIVQPKCYSFMGINTCRKTSDIELRFPFTPAWWVVNMCARANEVRDVTRIMQNTQVIGLFRRFETVQELLRMVESDMYERAATQAVAYFAKQGEVVELLRDAEVTYR